jgi:hypothetical protein
MQAALRALNRLVADGVIGDYAIGGAIGASFYIDALQTEDIDAFVVLPVGVSGLVSLTPVYQSLLAQGGIEEREYIRFGDWPLQILTDANNLIAEAIREAQQVAFEEIPTRVFRAEHLCAIALQTGRLKDYLRVTIFLEQGRVDLDALRLVAGRYGLRTQLTQVLGKAGGGDAGDR